MAGNSCFDECFFMFGELRVPVRLQSEMHRGLLPDLHHRVQYRLRRGGIAYNVCTTCLILDWVCCAPGLRTFLYAAPPFFGTIASLFFR